MQNYLKGKQGKYKDVLNNTLPLESYINHREKLNEKMNSSEGINKKLLEKQIEAIAEEVIKEIC